jgi:transcriptional regulator of acetoin/glycerol metabolism
MRRADIDRNAIKSALAAAHGIQQSAAEALGIPRSTLQKWLSGPLRDLRQYVTELREEHAPPGQGRPWKLARNRTRSAVARAWAASGYRLSIAARRLGIPRTSLRHLLYRYDLPNLPAIGRTPAKKTWDTAG